MKNSACKDHPPCNGTHQRCLTSRRRWHFGDACGCWGKNQIRHCRLSLQAPTRASSDGCPPFPGRSETRQRLCLHSRTCRQSISACRPPARPIYKRIRWQSGLFRAPTVAAGCAEWRRVVQPQKEGGRRVEYGRDRSMTAFLLFCFAQCLQTQVFNVFLLLFAIMRESQLVQQQQQQHKKKKVVCFVSIF